MVEMNYPKDFCTLVVYLFKTPPKYPRYHPTKNSNTDTYDNGDDNVIVADDKDIKNDNYTFMTPTSMVNIFRTHMTDSQVTKGYGEENNDKN